MFSILVAEPDLALQRQMVKILTDLYYHSETAENGTDALRIFEETHIDLIVCDTLMPGIDGYQLIQNLREGGNEVPIMLVSASGTFEDKDKGFLLGADDYMVKPIDVREMVVRIGAILRRARIANKHTLFIGDMLMDDQSLTVSRRDESIALPRKEFFLLFKLLSYPGRIFSRRALIDEIWGMDSTTDERTVDVHINRIRDRFRGWDVFQIVSVRGLGYKAIRMDKPHPAEAENARLWGWNSE